MGRDRKPIENTDKPSGQLGLFLTAELDRLGWSVDEFRAKLAAKKLDKTDDTIRNWLAGTNSPRIPELAPIASALGYKNWVAMVSAIPQRVTANPKTSRK